MHVCGSSLCLEQASREPQTESKTHCSPGAFSERYLLCLKLTRDQCPCRDEVGEYYAIDIGGTNFRSIHATLSDKKGKVVSCSLLPRMYDYKDSCAKSRMQCKAQ